METRRLILHSQTGSSARLFSLLMLAAVASAVCDRAARRAEGSTLVDGFDTLADDQGIPAGWTIIRGTGFGDDVIAYRGQRSLKLTATSSSDGAAAVQAIAAEGRCQLTVSVYVKGDRVRSLHPDEDGALGVWLRSDEQDPQDSRTSLAMVPLTGTFDWQRISGKQRIPNGVQNPQIVIGLPEGLTGVVWFDELRVKVDPSGRTGVPEVATGEHIVLSEGFETADATSSLPAGWTVNGQRIGLDDSTAFHGEQSLKLTNASHEENAHVTRTLVLKRGDTVRISVYVRGDSIAMVDDTGRGARVFLQWTDSKGGGGRAVVVDKPLIGTFDWQRVSGTVKVPATSVYEEITLELEWGSVGTAWFDDLVVEKVDAIPGWLIGACLLAFVIGLVAGSSGSHSRSTHSSGLNMSVTDQLWPRAREVIRMQMIQQGIPSEQIGKFLGRMDNNSALRNKMLSQLGLPLEKVGGSSARSEALTKPAATGVILITPLFLLDWKLVEFYLYVGAAGILGYLIARFRK